MTQFLYGTTPVAGMVHAAVLLLFMFLLAPLARTIPLASLAAILLIVAWNISEIDHFRNLLVMTLAGDGAELLELPETELELVKKQSQRIDSDTFTQCEQEQFHRDRPQRTCLPPGHGRRYGRANALSTAAPRRQFCSISLGT